MNLKRCVVDAGPPIVLVYDENTGVIVCDEGCGPSVVGVQLGDLLRLARDCRASYVVDLELT